MLSKYYYVLLLKRKTWYIVSFLTLLQITNISKIFIDPTYQTLDLILLNNNLIKHIDGDLLYNYLKNRSKKDFKINLANNKLETVSIFVVQLNCKHVLFPSVKWSP